MERHTNGDHVSGQWGKGRNHNQVLKRQAQRTLTPRCQQCGTPDRLELDHITPLCEDGPDTIDNCQWLCHTCHWRKTQAENRRAIQRKWALRYRPKQQHPSGTL